MSKLDIYLSVVHINPKSTSFIDRSHYRPISLIGCLYKVIAKVLASRLCKVISSIISPNQTAFIVGRQILDGVVIANEVINFAKKFGLELLLFKVDFAKAFDSVCWNFLDDVMDQMGFGGKWRSWIKGHLSSTRVSVLINGSPTSNGEGA